MATSAARRLALGAALLLAACLRAASGPGELEVPAPDRAAPPPADAPSPEIRVALVVGGRDVRVGGVAGLRVTRPGGEWLGDIRPGDERLLVLRDGGVAVRTPGGAATPGYDELRVVPADAEGLVRVNGREYRGTLRIVPDTRGLLIINELPIEQYLQSAVASELGRRDEREREALRAQAIVSRTFAFRNLGRYGSAGYDALATVADQAYGGAANEYPLATEAVAATRGVVVTTGGAVADVFFFSTCGGRTEDGDAAFRFASRPHLRSVPDDDGGSAYCAASPRFRWREEWTGEALRATLARTLPQVAGVPIEAIRQVRDVQVVQRSASGRAAAVQFALGTRSVRVEGQRIRDALRLANGEILRSTAIDLQVTRGPRGVERLVVEGRGAGHGVGLCQWGAIGRARAGQDHVRILAAYFPGTQVQQRW